MAPSSRKAHVSRLDDALVERGLADSLERARAEVVAGNVLVDEQPGTLPSSPVRHEATIRLRTPPAPFVSRAGAKLDAALGTFGVDPAGRACADLGASTGGFTDCLLQRGAARVYAVDVGYNQLAWKLRSDPRVVVMERTNARTLAGLPEPVSLVVGDVSFISLAQVLPTVGRLLGAPPADAVLLIKPQFEAARGALLPGGRVADDAREAVIAGVLDEARGLGFEVIGVAPSTVPGARAKNVEALVHLRLALRAVTAP